MNFRWIKCDVSEGQFPSEYAVSGLGYDGRRFSLFAPAETVEPDQQLLKVEVIDRKGGLALVRLPAETFETGQFVTVVASTLRSELVS